jgi:glycerol-3-phosphate acyltransferase PlsY
MEVALAAAIAFLTAFVAGSLPLGARLVERLSGWAPREVNPHLLGVENVTRLVGSGVALAAFGLDVLKGMLGLAAGVMTGWLFASLSFVGSLADAPGFQPGSPFAAAATESGLIAALAGAGLLGVVFGHLLPVAGTGSSWVD